MAFSKAVLNLDPAATVDTLSAGIRHLVHSRLRRKGAVVAISGGIDSSACLALCVNALGKENVFAVLMPDKDSSGTSRELGTALVERFGVASTISDITATCEAAGAYEEQNQAIREVFPDFSDEWKFKIVLPSILSAERLNISRITIQRKPGESLTQRLPLASYLRLVAATNFKQRVRTMMAYFHADRLNYAVCGTPNRLEYDQGFFVKGGDGLADFKPIAHLYKTQVFALAAHLNVPDEILSRTPTTDTFSLPQTQEEFYFALPYASMDLCLYGYNHGIDASEVAGVVGITREQVGRVYRDIEAKRKATLPLHLSGLLVEQVDEIRKTDA
jgi:NAD+ synthase